MDVAVIGLGGMGATHVGAAKESPYVNRVYGYEPDLARRNGRAGELGIVPADFDEILADPEIRLVCIASINSVHVEQAIRALRAGKAVMCEKPMGENLADAARLLQVAEETGGFLQIGFELHYSKMYQTAKQWIERGLIGAPVNVQCRYYCSEFHRRGNWRSQSTGSFLIGEKLSHYLDLQRWFMQSVPETVYSLSAPKVVSYFNHRDNHQILTRYANGGVGTLNFIMYIGESYHEDPLLEMLDKQAEDGHYLQYHICGASGAIETDVFRRRVRRWEFSEVEDGLESKIVEDITFDPREDQVWFHNTHGQNLRVIELVAKGLPPETPARDSFESMKLCFGAELSEDTGKIVRLDELNPLGK